MTTQKIQDNYQFDEQYQINTEIPFDAYKADFKYQKDQNLDEYYRSTIKLLFQMQKQQFDQSKATMEQTIENLDSIQQKWENQLNSQNLKIKSIEKNIQKKKITLYFIPQIYLEKFSFQMVITINLHKEKIETKCFLSYLNGLLYEEESQYLKLLMARYFVKQNSALRFGCFVINPNSGDFTQYKNDPLNKSAQDLYFYVPQQKSTSGLDIWIYSEIKLLNNSLKELEKDFDQSNSIGSGGFGDVIKQKIYYFNKEEQTLDKTVAVKKFRHKAGEISKNETNNETQILNQLKEKEFPYIGKYYYTKDKSDILMMEYYPHKSLDNFLINFQKTISLNTKIYFLWQITLALKFLAENKIYHLDLKPANVILSKAYITKLIDFGESFCENIHNQNDFKSGNTIPYAPPEILQKKQDPQKYSKFADIFSFGILMSVVLFDEYPIQQKRGSQQQIQQKYKDNKYRYYFSQDYKCRNGPKKLMKLLSLQIYQCLEDKSKYNQKHLVRRKNSNEKLDENLLNALQNMEHTKGNQKYVNLVASWVFMSCIIYLIYNNLENKIQH
ncbi:Protein kinase-like domain [Pseudocohnilembus persalinus]|uniref:Protein kinase-like domain n=1 Tax=Pseudocohnilembus persalinus TaxID=266149 RepID=A0A0V0R6K6_PSEPJ|nr:Protein kinase-like domain [Pseudocohnilembus persalinus]|eukprot:KRX10119.1 Protein kinase-like domain [Pseudocohnilembus persalinus]